MSADEPCFEIDIRLSVNGERVTRRVSARQHLADFLRDELSLTGTHLGCEHGVCGACAVRVDGQVVRGCLTLAVQAQDCEVETIEGLSDSGALADLQEEFLQRNAAQCGFCTAGMLLTANEFLERSPCASREQIREAISGNLCRCTGYQAIVDAVQATQSKRSGA
jgi:carbon-monoxide dehydrogenase small subunit